MPDLAAGVGITLTKEASTDVLRISTDVRSGRLIFSTYAELAADTSETAGTVAEVPLTDAGTHTDPVVGGTVNNTGIYRWSASPAGWERIADVDAVAASAFADAAADSEAAAAASATAAQGYASQPKYGGKINAWPDPFFRHCQIGVNFLGRKRWADHDGQGYGSLALVANSAYDGYALRKTMPAVQSRCGPLIRLDEIGAAVGDTITVSMLVKQVTAVGRTARCLLHWYGSNGVFVTGDQQMVRDSGTTGVVLSSSAQRLHYSGAVPTGAVAVAVEPYSTDAAVGETWDVLALWGYKGADIAGPAIPDFLGDDQYYDLLATTTKEYTGGPEQLFDASTLLTGVNVVGTANHNLVTAANSDTTIIYVGHLPTGTPLTISGLQSGSTTTFYGFYSSKPSVFDAAGTTAAVVSSGTLMFGTVTVKTLTVPSGAKWLAFATKNGNTNPTDVSNVVVRVGETPATGPVAYSRHVATFDQTTLLAAPSRQPYSGGTGFCLGDSISASTNVNSGSYLYPDGFGTRWPDYAIPLIQPDAYYSYAVSGAEFASKTTGLTTYQKFENQVTLALGQGITPRWLMLAMGTNDQASNSAALGTYAAAMAKSLTFDGSHTGTVSSTTLDVTISMDAMRLGLARLRDKFPTTVFFCALPIQRVGIALDTMRAWADEITKMAHAYGCIVIDQLGESGIIQEFEPGRDTADGTHPQPPTDTSNMGIRKQGWFLAGKIMAGLAGQDVPHAF